MRHSLSRIYRPQEHLKHPQNPYSIERACHKLSKTPSHVLIDAVGGSHHHFECATRALSGPNRIWLDQMDHKRMDQGGVGVAAQRPGIEIRSQIADPPPAPSPLIRAHAFLIVIRTSESANQPRGRDFKRGQTFLDKKGQAVIP